MHGTRTCAILEGAMELPDIKKLFSDRLHEQCLLRDITPDELAEELSNNFDSQINLLTKTLTYIKNNLWILLKNRTEVLIMTNEELFNSIKQMIVDQLGVDEDTITEDSSFVDDLNADSLDMVELVMAMEQEFDIEIPDDVAEKVVTVKDAVEYIQSLTEG